MALTRDFKTTVVARVERDPAFSKALLDEAATLFLSGEPETARLILRDLVNATRGGSAFLDRGINGIWTGHHHDRRNEFHEEAQT